MATTIRHGNLEVDYTPTKITVRFDGQTVPPDPVVTPERLPAAPSEKTLREMAAGRATLDRQLDKTQNEMAAGRKSLQRFSKPDEVRAEIEAKLAEEARVKLYEARKKAEADKEAGVLPHQVLPSSPVETAAVEITPPGDFVEYRPMHQRQFQNKLRGR